MASKRFSPKYYNLILDEVSDIKGSYYNLVVGQIERIVKSRNLMMSGLILMLCAVDYLKTFYYGLISLDGSSLRMLEVAYIGKRRQLKYLKRIIKLKDSKKHKILKRPWKPGDYYQGFLRKYLQPVNSKYDVNEIYSLLRCGLVHNYSTRKPIYGFIQDEHEFAKHHLQKIIDPKNGTQATIFNVDSFYRDFLEMNDAYWKDVEKSLAFKEKIHKVGSYIGFIKVAARQ